MLLLVFVSFFLPLAFGQCGPKAFYEESFNRCLVFYDLPMNFTDAVKVCAATGGNLPSIHGLPENNFISELARAMGAHDVWIGARAKDIIVIKNLNWIWTDGSNFNYFKNIEGLSAKGKITCMKIVPETGAWNTSKCTDQFPFFCSHPPLEQSRPRSRCPSGYTWFNSTDSCYKVILREVYFSDAERACRDEGAQLTSIHSKIESDFLVELSSSGINMDTRTHSNIFIGLHYKNDEWKWTDGTPLNYTNWAIGEPNLLGFEHYGVLITETSYRSKYFWNNVPDVPHRGFICKTALLN